MIKFKTFNSRKILLSLSGAALLVFISSITGLNGVDHLNISNNSNQTPKYKFEGEFGLFIRILEDETEVNWITRNEDSGTLKVYYHGELIKEAITTLSRTHTVGFNKVGNGEYELHYGGDDSSTISHTTVSLGPNIRPKAIIAKVDSIFVVGDVHGRYNEFSSLLRKANIIDEDDNWTGGSSHLVMLGDLFDRGYDVTKVLWMLYKLERQAKANNGFVHILLGNHELMTFINDLRYLSPKERLIASMYKTSYSEMFDVHQSLLGKWLSTKPGIIKIDDVLFAHGGIIDLPFTISAFNDSLYKFIHEPGFLKLVENEPVSGISLEQWDMRQSFFFYQANPFWFRGFVQTDTLVRELRATLKQFNSKMHVVAHTTVETIGQSYSEKLITTDLNNAATEILLLTRTKRNKYLRYKIDLNGNITPLTSQK